MAALEISRSVREVHCPDGTTISYSVGGGPGGPTLVAVHGMCCRKEHFDALIEYLPTDYRVVAVDLAEHGASRSDRSDFSITSFARDVLAVVEAEQVDRCIVVGHSMGGAVGIELAVIAPEKIDAVVGLDSVHYAGLYPAQTAEAVAAVVDPMAADWIGGTRGLITWGTVPGSDPEVSEDMFRQMSGMRQPAGLRALRGLLEWDLGAALSATDRPLVVFAARDLYDVEANRVLEDRVTFHSVDLGGHFFLVDHAQETAQLLVDAVGRLAGGRA
ncbi:alpha/beta fold hydrolase [Nakamurella sp. YIM 132087]|uniref:Alpha/beta fold hydrolase n=1 Tax=Nakamurella alba TaxID=2665158 RepID=A0A7K1FPW1_9ACTN|nr:alpha/beta hydrolase [Nakamurella alba]MTD16186.1 alpha/beta fold hydrolase [Nakamurella alba]